MQEKALIVGCYAILTLAGGIMGYVVANSLPSLLMSSLFSCSLFVCSAFIWQGHLKAYDTASVLIAALCAFFSFRFYSTYKLMPAGFMAVMSGMLLIYLYAQRQKFGAAALK